MLQGATVSSRDPYHGVASSSMPGCIKLKTTVDALKEQLSNQSSSATTMGKNTVKSLSKSYLQNKLEHPPYPPRVQKRIAFQPVKCHARPKTAQQFCCIGPCNKAMLSVVAKFCSNLPKRRPRGLWLPGLVKKTHRLPSCLLSHRASKGHVAKPCDRIGRFDVTNCVFFGSWRHGFAIAV